VRVNVEEREVLVEGVGLGLGVNVTVTLDDGLTVAVLEHFGMA